MNFSKIFACVALVLALSLGQANADFWSRLGKGIERVGQNVRDATIQTLGIAQQAADVAATARD
ncbi:hypothetical protein KR222_001598, partial [Zaprionus bogoriensis]